MNTGNPNEHDPSEASFAQLLQSAGRGPQLSDEARQRIRAQTEAAWKEALRATGSDNGMTGQRVAPQRRSAAPRSRRRPFVRRWLAPALAASLAAAFVITQFIDPQTPAVSEQNPFARVAAITGAVASGNDAEPVSFDAVLRIGDSIRTGIDGRAALRMPSGDEIRLNSNTEISITDTDAVELVAGMLYFDASPDKAHNNFYVRTRFGDVAHVGTQYAADVNSEGLTVSVREGMAVVTQDDAQTTIAMGERADVGSSGGARLSELSNDSAIWAWTEDLAIADFDGPDSAATLITWAARQTGRSVRFQTQAARTTAEDTTLNQVRGLTPSEVLSVIRSTTALSLTESSTELVVALR